MQYDAHFNTIMLICNGCGFRISHSLAAVNLLKNAQLKNNIEVNDTVKIKMFNKRSQTHNRSHVLGLDGRSLCNTCAPTEEELANTLVGTINDCECRTCLKRIRRRGYAGVDVK